jgi:hypothetical protein
VEAKYPALLFKQQLDAFVQKIFPMMRDNVKKQITPMLANCIHTPRGVARGAQVTRRWEAGRLSVLAVWLPQCQRKQLLQCPSACNSWLPDIISPAISFHVSLH